MPSSNHNLEKTKKIGEQLKEAMKKINKTKYRVMKESKVSQKTLYALLEGNQGGYNIDSLLQVMKCLDLNDVILE